MEQQIVKTGCASFVDDTYRLLNELKSIIKNLKKCKKILEPIIYTSVETIRGLNYIKYELEPYFQQYEDTLNKYKTSLERIKKFAKEIEKIEQESYVFYPYIQVNEEYDKLITEHKICEKNLNSILINVIIVKQEKQQKDFRDIHEILKTIPVDNKNQTLIQIEKIIIERSVLDFSVPRIYSSLLSDPPVANDPDKNQDEQDDRVQPKQIVKKIYKGSIEVACEPITFYSNNMSMLAELKRFNDNRNILKFYGIWKIDDLTNYMEPKITNFYYAKHVLEADKGSDDFILNIINWAAPEMMKTNSRYTEECEVFSFVMLLWELAYQKIPYQKMAKDEIIIHVTQNRRETEAQPFYSLDLLHAQRKYLRIIKEGWCGKPEKRITMDEILLRLSEIDIELIKNEANKLAQSYGKLDQPSNIFKLLEIDILDGSPIFVESNHQR
ncbi:25198_t:CDS:2 [Cetraspora pellucida]|uniref:25198_t:CDS:1 n=1 Tax=Cetraspora pellucida TaxID=1433469 RepID=A0A9N9EFK5_9GLOM|nr:25198_t:CDS:2 [Cetraspora pellucida]